MSADAVARVAADGALRSTGKYWQLVDLHVTLDRLTGASTYEAVALRSLCEGSRSVAVTGASGAGKTSLVMWVCAQLPETHFGLRIPLTAVSDPTSNGEVMKLTLATALAVIGWSSDDRKEIETVRADTRTASWQPVGLVGGKLGGGPIPAEISLDLGTLREQFESHRLDGEYLQGLNRLVEILKARGRTPVFVFEDTEAIVGGAEEQRRVEGFFAGPLKAFAEEIDAPCLVAIQAHLTEGSAAFDRLAPSFERISIPLFGDSARDVLASILDHRLGRLAPPLRLGEVMAGDGLDGLVSFYDEKAGDLRRVLAVARTSADEAAAQNAEIIRAAHVRVGAANWR